MGGVRWSSVGLDGWLYLFPFILLILLTESRPLAIDCCNLMPDPRNGKRPDNRTCNITPAPHTSQPLPYKRPVTTSGDI